MSDIHITYTYMATYIVMYQGEAQTNVAVDLDLKRYQSQSPFIRTYSYTFNMNRHTAVIDTCFGSTCLCKMVLSYIKVLNTKLQFQMVI